MNHTPTIKPPGFRADSTPRRYFCRRLGDIPLRQVCSTTTSNAPRNSGARLKRSPVIKRSATSGYRSCASRTPVGAMSSPVTSTPERASAAASLPRPQPGTSTRPCNGCRARYCINGGDAWPRSQWTSPSRYRCSQSMGDSDADSCGVDDMRATLFTIHRSRSTPPVDSAALIHTLARS